MAAPLGVHFLDQMTTGRSNGVIDEEAALSAELEDLKRQLRLKRIREQVDAAKGSILLSIIVLHFGKYIPSNLNDGHFGYMFFTIGAMVIANIAVFTSVMNQMKLGTIPRDGTKSQEDAEKEVDHAQTKLTVVQSITSIIGCASLIFKDTATNSQSVRPGR